MTEENTPNMDEVEVVVAVGILMTDATAIDGDEVFRKGEKFKTTRKQAEKLKRSVMIIEPAPVVEPTPQPEKEPETIDAIGTITTTVDDGVKMAGSEVVVDENVKTTIEVGILKDLDPEPKPDEIPEDVDDESTGSPDETWTVTGIKEWLDDSGIEHPRGALKAELLEIASRA